MADEEKREIRGRLPRSKKIALDVACAKREMSQQQGVEEAIEFWLEIQDQVEVLIEKCESMGIAPEIALQQAVALWLEKHH
ncbi:hypothetical protein IFO70_33830 [Phormidium tenue FACHB-886]|nr:hypothetical protein [Phormidium tenue FACHB-886]